MPNTSLGRWLTPSAQPDADRGRRPPARAPGRRPFRRLVEHFLDRQLRGGHAEGTEFELGAGALLGLLAAPGAFQCFLMIDRYSTLLDWVRRSRPRDLLATSAPDKFAFLSIAMAIAGIVAALKWDRILPDAQDYLNLAPLPIRPRQILLANVCAIAIAVVAIAVAVNCVSMVLFPAIVSAASLTTPIAFLPFLAVHSLSVSLASLFGFGVVFAVLGTLAAVLPRETFRAASSWLRGALLVAFLAILANGFAGPLLLRELARTPDSLVRFLPPVWFLGLYQSLQNRATPALAHVASWPWLALAATLGLAALAYGFGYRRRFAAVLEGQRRPAEQRVTRLALAFFDRCAPSEPGFARASFRFAVRALLRNDAQRLCLAVSLALGWLLAFQSASAAFSNESPDRGRELSFLAAPLVAAFLLGIGLRVAFEIPAASQANWLFRIALHERDYESLGVARRVILAFASVFVLTPCFAFSFWLGGPGFALLHTGYVLALFFCLVEILLEGYRKIPFTCSLPGFRQNLPMVCLLYFLGFAAFTQAGATLDRWLLAEPWRFVLVSLALTAAWEWNRRRLRDARAAGVLEEGLTFDSLPPPPVERLNLFDSA